MSRWLLALTAVLCVNLAVAQDNDRLDSPACRQALTALQAQEAQALAASQVASAPAVRDRSAALTNLKDMRMRAARTCLGASANAPAPARMAQPPISVPPVGGVAMPRPLQTPTVPRSPSVAVPRNPETPRSVSGCDAVGCWAGDGSYLLRSGPNLVSPRGLCTLQGTTLVCP